MRALVELLASYDKRYVAKGYPPEAIDELERELERPLPAAYRDFLETAAANFKIANTSFDPEEVLDLIQDVKDRLPPFLTPIAVDDSGCFQDLYLDLRFPAWEGDARVVSKSAGNSKFDDVYFKYTSLKDMLFPMGFIRVRMALFPAHLWVRMEPVGSPASHASLSDQAHRVFVQLGFKELIGLTETRFYERGDCAARVYVYGSTSAGTHLAGVDCRTVEIVAEALCENVAARTRIHTGLR